ncbi:hypothetical protein DFJ74DRAFT_665918 [Hyaloraphidium curvatum]|nr:hypothetical protein DFJ74DRAFT_665918 [Hyaloraphidium curvatum]
MDFVLLAQLAAVAVAALLFLARLLRARRCDASRPTDDKPAPLLEVVVARADVESPPPYSAAAAPARASGVRTFVLRGAASSTSDGTGIHLFVGNIVHCRLPKDSQVFLPVIEMLGPAAALGVDPAGVIRFVTPELGCVRMAVEAAGGFVLPPADILAKEIQEAVPHMQGVDLQIQKVTATTTPSTFIFPGFIDTHIHASQYVFAGTGLDLPLLEWLNTYTFPREAAFKDVEYARMAYRKAVAKTLRCGTTAASYYATIHLEGSKVLADEMLRQGQRGLVGKVCMDRNGPDYYVEDTGSSLSDTRDFVQHVLHVTSEGVADDPHKVGLIRPVVTPRFVPTCTDELLSGLGQIAKEFSVPIQSHTCENPAEVGWVHKLHPHEHNYVEVYDKYGLLGPTSIMAHGIYLSDDEREMMVRRDVGLSHCPTSNFALGSGICNVRHYMCTPPPGKREGFTDKIGLGTDVSGGYSPSLQNTVRDAMTAGKILSMPSLSTTPTEHRHRQPALNLAQVLYFATVGGAKVLGLENVVGNFEVGKEFDALVIDLENPENPVDIFPHDTMASIIEKWVYLGDISAIRQVYVRGRMVSGAQSS